MRFRQAEIGNSLAGLLYNDAHDPDNGMGQFGDADPYMSAYFAMKTTVRTYMIQWTFSVLPAMRLMSV